MPTGRSGIAGAVVDGHLYVFGGEGNPNNPQGVFPENEVYDPETNTWKSLASMPTPRHGIGAAVIDKKIFIPGGAPVQGFGITGVNEIFLVQTETLNFALFAAGQEITTEITLINFSESQRAIGVFDLFDQMGNPLMTSINGSQGTSFSFTIPPLGSTTFKSDTSTQDLRVGSIIISSDISLNGTILFSSSIPNLPETAGVNASLPFTRFIAPVQRNISKSIRVGIAIANTTNSTTTVSLALRNEDGKQVDTATVPLASRGQIVRFIEELFTGIDTSNFRGTVTATSTSSVAAIVLLFSLGEFATLSVSGK